MRMIYMVARCSRLGENPSPFSHSREGSGVSEQGADVEEHLSPQTLPASTLALPSPERKRVPPRI